MTLNNSRQLDHNSHIMTRGISDRIRHIPLSPIRKLTPLADEARSRGITVYHLNIGQPDIQTPEQGLAAMRNIDRKVLEYSPSQGFLSLRRKIAEYYADFGIEYDPDEIIVTTGASEAVLFSFITCFDPGDELITTEPTYANYLSFAAAAGVKVVPITTSIDDGFALPPAERFEELITERTRGILICNPNNPSGSLYSREEMKMLGDIVRRHGIFLFADEVYREFVYDGMEFFSAGHLEGVDDNVVIFDSMSKRFSECGIRTGAVITRNRAVTEGFLKLAQARLSPPLVGQIIAEASFSAGHAYLDPIAKEYQHRRDVLIEGLQNIPGIRVARPQGAFYVIASLPVENAEDFCAWCLSDFSDNGETVMMAPASGFYITPGLGPSEVRIAYVLNTGDLRRATDLLAKALRQYTD